MKDNTLFVIVPNINKDTKLNYFMQQRIVQAVGNKKLRWQRYKKQKPAV